MKDQTKAACKALLSLDPYERERRDLLASGVSPARVLNLYPHEFEPLAPGLQDALRHRVEALPELVPLAKFTGSIMMQRQEFMLTTVRYPKIASAYVRAATSDRGLNSLTDWVKLNAVGNEEERAWLALKAGEMLWFSHAFAVHYEELSSEHQLDASALIEGVAKSLRLIS